MRGPGNVIDDEDFKLLYARETPLISQLLEEIEQKNMVDEKASELAGARSDCESEDINGHYRPATI